MGGAGSTISPRPVIAKVSETVKRGRIVVCPLLTENSHLTDNRFGPIAEINKQRERTSSRLGNVGWLDNAFSTGDGEAGVLNGITGYKPPIPQDFLRGRPL